MTYLLSCAINLCLVLVINPVKAAIEIILVLAPGDASHDMDTVTTIAPGLNAGWQPGINSIDDRHIRTQVARGAPAVASLKAGALEDLLRFRRESWG